MRRRSWFLVLLGGYGCLGWVARERGGSPFLAFTENRASQHHASLPGQDIRVLSSYRDVISGLIPVLQPQGRLFWRPDGSPRKAISALNCEPWGKRCDSLSCLMVPLTRVSRFDRRAPGWAFTGHIGPRSRRSLFEKLARILSLSQHSNKMGLVRYCSR
jgi:hypothetical protein